jgi:hypothetical protein
MEEDKVMGAHLFKNWMVYVGIIGFIWFLFAVLRNAKRQEKMKQEQNKTQDK